MLTKTELLAHLHDNKELYRSLYGIDSVAVFGSFARGEQSEVSDIDILISMEPGTENMFEKRLAFRDLLSERFLRKIDVCYEQAIRPQFRSLIIKEAIYV
jgi:predicted nucleotidyltransferase